ncbi:MAG: 2Fe-2S iron-sulfur cluster-binding protein [Thermoplasmatota archaeon]
MDLRVPGRLRGREVRFSFDGRPIRAFEGETIGAALHAAERPVLSRSLKYHRPRGLFCMTSRCGNCMMRVGGVPNIRVCTLPATEGLLVETQNALPSGRLDVLQASDRMFPHGFDPHDKFVRPRFLTGLYQRFIRAMAGYGKIPARTPLPPRRMPITKREADVVVVGVGSAGAAAALSAAKAGVTVLAFEESPWIGGDLALVDPARGRALASEVHAEPNIDLQIRTPVVGIYPTEPSSAAPAAGNGDTTGATESPPPAAAAPLVPRLLVAQSAAGLVEVRARAIVLATGANETPPLFGRNDIPGVFGIRAGLLMVERYSVLPGSRSAISGEGPLADALSARLRDAGAPAIRVDGMIREAVGSRAIRGLRLDSPARKIACDALCATSGDAPAIELVQQAGCNLRWDPEAGGLVPAAEGTSDPASGATSVAGVFVAGNVRALKTPQAAFWEGAAVGEAAVRWARALAAVPEGAPRPSAPAAAVGGIRA